MKNRPFLTVFTMDKTLKFEICANSAASCLAAQEGGAHRVELCAGIPEGGTTPSWGEVKAARHLLTTTRLYVIIRPRGGDFLYSELEQEIMIADIEAMRELGADGVVIGCLTAEGDLDLPLMQRLKQAAGGMDVTCHRAFDMCRDPRQALEQLISIGIKRVLTSGQQPTAEQGIPLLAELVAQAGDRLSIMPGCKVSASNIDKIARMTGAHEFHFSARSSYESGMKYRNPSVSMGGTVKIDEYWKDVTDACKVKETIGAVKN